MQSRAYLFEAMRSSWMISERAKNYSFTASPYLSALLATGQGIHRSATQASWTDRRLSVLKKKDDVCDDLVVRYFRALDLWVGFPDANIDAAATILYDKTKQYRGIQNAVYGKESEAISSLLNDLSSDNLAAQVAKLPAMSTLTTALKDALIDFNASSIELFAKTAGRGPSAGTYRMPLIDNINEIAAYLNVMAKADPETYSEFSNYVNLVIDRVNQNVRARRNGKKEPFPEMNTDQEGHTGNEDGTEVTPTDEPNPNPGTGTNPGTNPGTSSDDDDSMPSA